MCFFPTVVLDTRGMEFPYHLYVHVLMREERRKEERSKQGQTNKAKQHSTTKEVTFPKNELPQVGLEPTTLYTLHCALPLSYQGSSAGWAKISHLMVFT